MLLRVFSFSPHPYPEVLMPLIGLEDLVVLLPLHNVEELEELKVLYLYRGTQTRRCSKWQ